MQYRRYVFIFVQAYGLRKGNIMNKGIRRLITSLTAALLAACTLTVPADSGLFPRVSVTAEAASKLAFTTSAKTVNVGEPLFLAVNSKSDVKWSTSDKKTATVDSNGRVFGVKAGKAKITAKVGSRKITRTVTVKSAKVKTPAKIVKEMTWGLNFVEPFNSFDYKGFDEIPASGYSDYPPFALGLWFWNGDYIQIARLEAHDKKFTVSADLPEYNGEKPVEWVTGLFNIMPMMTVGGHTFKFKISDAKLILADGSSEKLSVLNKTYTADQFERDDNGWYFSWIDYEREKLQKPNKKYNGSKLQMKIEVVSLELEEGKTKADYYYNLSDPFHNFDDYDGLLKKYEDNGANVVRLCVTWAPFIKNDTFEIEKDWLALVQKTVDSIISTGAYCIIEMHHDYLHSAFVGERWEELWMKDEYKDYIDKRFSAAWSQIAEYFKNYSQKLIFEPFNEPAMIWRDEYDPSSDNYFEGQADRINDLNKIFVSTVRKTGGNNKTRLLMLPSAGYCSPMLLDKMELPADKYIAATVHPYMDVLENGTYGTTVTESAEKMFGMISGFTKKTGVPVIIGETGIMNDSGTTDSQKKVVKEYFTFAEKYGVPCLWWEDWGADAFGLYDKTKDKWARPGLLKIIKNIVMG